MPRDGGSNAGRGGSGEDHRSYDPAVESPTVVVAQGVAAVLGAEQADLPPLWNTLDPDALDALLGDGEHPDLTVSFTYSGVEVTATGDGHVWFRRE